jgi:RNA-dependent RNA polymerase
MLYRPLIAILEHLGVATDWFLRLQTLALSEANDTLLSISEDAAEFLNTRHLGRPYGFPAIIRGLKKYGISRAILEDAPHPMLDFFLRSLSVAIVHVDRELKYRARIRVPWGHSLVGVADVHKELEEWCVYSTFLINLSICGLKFASLYAKVGGGIEVVSRNTPSR